MSRGMPGPASTGPVEADLQLGHLAVGPIPRDGEMLFLEERALLAMEAMAAAWPGRLRVLSPGFLDVAGEPPAGLVPVRQGRLSFDVAEVDQTPEALDAQGLDLLTGLLAPHTGLLTAARTPAILTAEVTYAIRLGILRASQQGGLSRIGLARSAVGLRRRERRVRAQARAALSLQCNGPAALAAYGPLTEAPLGFMDHRITGEDVACSRQSPPWDGEGPLRLGFSGRLVPIKGPEFAVEAAYRARAAGLPVELSIFGAGAMEQRLRAEAAPWMRFRGFRDFRGQWLDEVREEVDLMVAPHVQGDPSCTYFEALGAGAPLLSFANQTSTPLVRDHGVGWTVPRGDVDALVHQIRGLFEEPQRLIQARTAGLDLLAAHDFETTVARKADHLLERLRSGR